MATFYFDPDPKASHAELLRKLQQVKDLSKFARNTDLAKLQPEALRGLEEHILNEARTAARTSGRLFESIEREKTGREISRFEGDPKAWLKPFMAKSVTFKFNPNAGKRYVEGHWEKD